MLLGWVMVTNRLGIISPVSWTIYPIQGVVTSNNSIPVKKKQVKYFKEIGYFNMWNSVMPIKSSGVYPATSIFSDSGSHEIALHLL